MTSRVPVPGAEDLYPHVSRLSNAGDDPDGAVVCSSRVFGLLMAPTVEEFLAAWERYEQRAGTGGRARFEYPPEWERGARRRTKELQARYGTSDMIEILRGLHREYGVLPPGD